MNIYIQNMSFFYSKILQFAAIDFFKVYLIHSYSSNPYYPKFSIKIRVSKSSIFPSSWIRNQNVAVSPSQICSSISVENYGINPLFFPANFQALNTIINLHCNDSNFLLFDRQFFRIFIKIRSFKGKI